MYFTVRLVADDQDKRPAGDARDRHDIADEIVIKLLVQCHGNCVLRTTEEERVAIR